MVFLKQFFKRNIYIAQWMDPIYGSDQANNTYPIRFPTVTFGLLRTYSLVEIADSIRMDLGYKPMTIKEEYDEIDRFGRYTFYIGLNGYSKTKVDSCITFQVKNSDSNDNESFYHIDLTEAEQSIIFSILDKQCRSQYHKSCDDLLKEAEDRMLLWQDLM